MKNIRVYDCFLDNIDSRFKVRYFMISLVRTLIYNLDGDSTIYYRKRCTNPRKISLFGKEKRFRCKKINFKRFKFKKYGMRNINGILSEYVTIQNSFAELNNNNFDIAKKYSKKKICIDSIIRREYSGEIITMCFDEENDNNVSTKNIFWINSMNKYNDLNNHINI